MGLKSVLFLFIIASVSIIGFVDAAPFGYNSLGDINPTFGYGGVEISNITNVYNNYSVNGTSLTLNDITDVNAPSPTEAQVLTWDSGTSKWIAKTIVSWFVDDSNGYLYNDSDTFYFNETKLNLTIDLRAPSSATTKYTIYFNHSSKSIITYNLSDSDASVITLSTVPGQKEIYGSEFA